MEQILNMLKELIKQDEMFTLSAQITKKAIDALMKEGFTRQEAIELVRAQSTSTTKIS